MRLPSGFTVRIADGVRTVGDGSILVGGSPMVVSKLSDTARAFLDGACLEVRGSASSLLAERLLASNLAVPVLDTGHIARADQLTVIIPVRDRPQQLDRALSALSGLHVVVVDDASTDRRSIQRVVERHRAELIALDRNVGPGAARNAGLLTVATRYVALVDSDVTVAADTLLGLTAHFADPSLAVVAPHVRSRPANAQPRWFERYDQATPPLGLGERPGVVRPGAAVAWLPSACLVARTDRLGSGFDPGMRVGEDVDLVWRLTAAGHRVRYDPSFCAYHDSRPTLRSWIGRKFTYGTGGADLAGRHPGNAAPAIMTPVMAATSAAVLMMRPWSIPFAVAGIIHGARAVSRTLPACGERDRLAVQLSMQGFGWTLRQGSALLLRHWWPVAVGAALTSRTARRMLIGAAVVDVFATTIERPDLDPMLTFAGRRMDDLAYGAGLWWGAVKHRSIACLKVKWNVKRTRTSRGRRDGGRE